MVFELVLLYFGFRSRCPAILWAVYWILCSYVVWLTTVWRYVRHRNEILLLLNAAASHSSKCLNNWSKEDLKYVKTVSQCQFYCIPYGLSLHSRCTNELRLNLTMFQRKWKKQLTSCKTWSFHGARIHENVLGLSAQHSSVEIERLGNQLSLSSGRHHRPWWWRHRRPQKR